MPSPSRRIPVASWGAATPLAAQAAVRGASLLAFTLVSACSRAPVPSSAPAPQAAAAADTAQAEHAGHEGHAQQPAPATAPSHEHHHGTDAPITIPEGALYTEADVRFMQGMIAHHAQAVHMTRVARDAGGDARVLKLAHKIDLSQAGEIALMQDWLRAHNQFVPDTSSWRTMTMHGMLTPDEIAQLEQSRGAEFDRLFLTFMIRHHEGAIQMVTDLFNTPRSGQDVDVSVLANDVETTQAAEIAMMRQMLIDMFMR